MISSLSLSKQLTTRLQRDNFQALDKLIQAMAHAQEAGLITQEEITRINRSFGDTFLAQTVQGHGLRKPFGYAGDFAIIDKIYTHHRSNHPTYQVWDDYFHTQAAVRAVRNRKTYFKRLVSEHLSTQRSLSLLNLASGPARDLLEAYNSLSSPERLQTTCVEMDSNAITHAKQLNEPHLAYITFIEKNIFRFQTQQTFDLIWSSGLFDYFDDKAFIRILQRCKNWLTPGGEMVIGNFNQDHNPSRAYMELFGEWYLHHRTKAQLIELGSAAGFSEDQLSVHWEPEQVNLFLHLQG